MWYVESETNVNCLKCLNTVKSRNNNWILIHLSMRLLFSVSSVMSRPLGLTSCCKPSTAIICKMTSEHSSTRSSVCATMKPDTQRHWQTSLSSAQIYNTLPSNLGLFSCWHPKASVRCMPAELKCAHRVHTAASLPALMPSPCLPWHFLNLMGKKWPIANDKSSAREHIYTS